MKKKDVKTFHSEQNRTSWGKVAGWYDDMLEGGTDNYQSGLILPNLLRILDIKMGMTIADVACGQGFFSREFARLGARVYGSDISGELIRLAEKNTPPLFRQNVTYQISPSDNLFFLKSESIDVAVIVLALQNIEKVKETISECQRVLKSGGKLVLVLNHPAFRIPKASSWGWDQSSELKPGVKGVQYRRIDQYLSELKSNIQMHPGEKPEEMTVSFHRPLPFYFKALAKSNLLVSRFEEWTSNRVSEKGPRAEAEDRARKEIPLFLCIEAVKNSCT